MLKQSVYTKDLFPSRRSLFADYLFTFVYPWQILGGLGTEAERVIERLLCEGWEEIAPRVVVGKNVSISETATLTAPCIVGSDTEIRPGAFLRGNTVIGEGCVIGNSTEIKNALLFDGVAVPHYNYIGDSVLGYGVHFGAGALTSNLKGDKSEVIVRTKSECFLTGRRKVGAMVGDGVEIGCHAVLNPGTVIGKDTTVYPLSSVRGTVPENCIYKQNGILTEKE